EILIKMIEESTQNIYMTVYKLDIDATTVLVLDALQKKAQEGIPVRILLDALGSIKLYLLQYKLRSYRKSGIVFAFFMPFIKMPFRNYINLRNHRKAFVFDEKAVLSGGINLADIYLGPTQNEKRWADIVFLIKGKASKTYLEIFFADWAYATNEVLRIQSSEIQDCGTVDVQVIPSGPDVKADVFYEELLKLIYEAKHRIWIVTPYFLPDEGILNALIIAKHHGVDVRLITPRDSDHVIADLGRSSFMREIEEHGIYVGLFEGKMLHAKAIIIDDMGVLGSANISYRSMFLNYETMSLFDSKEVVSKIEKWMNYLLDCSTQEIKHNGKIRRVGENLMKVFTPLM
ncbi:MAG: phospholipase D-like domain-containing protein, partial [Thiovulaceae bacterium]|nr:phospholipase D-like domain-containing protein [Sulfurimonadaceae bacterium]